VLGTDTPLIGANDPQALAAAMRAHLDDPLLARERAHRLRLSLSRGFSVSAMAESILAFYKDAARHRSPSPAPRRGQHAHEAA
jgi:glycosyltransferase involved in cell wall biosynthesis